MNLGSRKFVSRAKLVVLGLIVGAALVSVCA